MARRRPPDVGAPREDLPERLRQCWVEDWVNLETARRELTDQSGSMPWYAFATRQAFHAWTEARNQWAVMHGMANPYGGPSGEFFRRYGNPSPRWRHSPRAEGRTDGTPAP